MVDIPPPMPDFSGSGPVEYRPTAPAAGAALPGAEGRDRLMAVPGVVSVGLGEGPGGAEAVVVGVLDAGVAARLPSTMGGVPVTVVVTGPVNALDSR